MDAYYPHVVFAIAMGGIVLLMFGYEGSAWALFDDTTEDPETRAQQNGLFIIVGFFMTVYAMVITPFVAGFF